VCDWCAQLLFLDRATGAYMVFRMDMDGVTTIRRAAGTLDVFSVSVLLPPVLLFFSFSSFSEKEKNFRLFHRLGAASIITYTHQPVASFYTQYLWRTWLTTDLASHSLRLSLLDEIGLAFRAGGLDHPSDEWAHPIGWHLQG